MIQVSISKTKLDAAGHETLIGMHVMKALKAAHIPAMGVFAMRGVTRGRLTYWNTEYTHNFEWVEDESDKDRNFVDVRFEGKLKADEHVSVKASKKHVPLFNPIDSDALIEDDDEL